jgi:hypothetical protein
MYVALLKSRFILYDTFVLPLDAYWHTYYSRYYWGLGRLFLHGPASRYSTYYSHFFNAFDIWTTKSIHIMAEYVFGLAAGIVDFGRIEFDIIDFS